jgi:lysozyme family protein
MNPHVRRFFLIFCIIGTLVSGVLAVANASAKPVSTSGVVTFAIACIMLAIGAALFRNRREA